MEKLARKLANSISLTLDYNEEKEAVIAYGFIALIQVSVTLILVLLFGILIRAPVEAMIICLSASILRKYSGGAHASTAELCTLISTLYCTLMAFFAKELILILNQPINLTIVILIFGLSFWTIRKFAPIDSPNKPIKTEKKKKMKKRSLIVLIAYFIISIMLLIIGKRVEVLNSYGISIIFGVSWQVFTLTKLGLFFFTKFKFYNKKEV